MNAHNLIICDDPQGTDAWLKARLGVITASKAHDLLLNKRTKTPTYKEARQTYMNQLIGEVCTGYSEELNAKALEWGKLNEDAAIAAYEFATGNEVEKIGLVYKDSTKRAGASADFKLVGKNHGGENKCPMNPMYHIDFLRNGEIKDEYITQIQFGLWVTGWDLWDYTSYHPKMKLKTVHHVTIERDKELMDYFDNEVPKFIQEMDEALEKIGIKFGSQWEV